MTENGTFRSLFFDLDCLLRDLAFFVFLLVRLLERELKDEDVILLQEVVEYSEPLLHENE